MATLKPGLGIAKLFPITDKNKSMGTIQYSNIFLLDLQSRSRLSLNIMYQLLLSRRTNDHFQKGSFS